MVIIGKSSAYSSPVLGFIDAGPVEPLHPPNTFEHMTKYFSVTESLSRT